MIRATSLLALSSSNLLVYADIFQTKQIASSLFTSGSEAKRSSRYNVNLFEEILQSPNFQRECISDGMCNDSELREITKDYEDPEAEFDRLWNRLWKRCWVEACDPSGASTFRVETSWYRILYGMIRSYLRYVT